MKRVYLILMMSCSLAVMAAFNNCTRANISSDKSSYVAQSGNGDSYDGKLAFFENFEAAACSQRTAAGKAFPNQQIFQQNGVFALVREGCKDIEPRNLQPNEYQFDRAAGTIMYQGKAYALNANLKEYDTIAHLCPAQRAVTNLAPVDLIASPVDLSSADWFRHSGIASGLFGSISAMPRYRVERTDQAFLEYWRRLSQLQPLQSNTQYAFRILLAAGNKSQAVVNFYNADSLGFAAVVDLNSSGSSLLYAVGMNAPEVVVQPYGAGLSVTVFFTTPNLINQTSDVGLAPYDAAGNAVGDYIYATAASLLATQSYCAP